MLIVYLSLTGNVRNFIKRIDMDSLEINYTNPLIEVTEDFVVIVPTYDDDITEIISIFIDYKNNMNHLIGFVGSGSLNYNDKFCFNAKDLSMKYNKPLLFTFEASGTESDVLKFKKEVKKFGITCTK
ncbi:ribonucleotide reductase stimulatory protein [Heyndrickxia shackletonii]|uniref:Ribonucleotide reductase stimulatory protein n=1 Tax=Heyndrickxia shackletonii TaxID=157838 RepID=A0A0Q3WX47_9BACI|nr:class Ib ribonucleoside-diphosphate reductase assembly flavoprotein NrdI [Heyndrickxia shackletonii]KQL53815.1 ribonucleotide reductase stimulatory protein [Heyndrickxia shackletonii]MBB2482688.1 class Ib ribonucleoside-diphosphate reductase assembly flavoprotein NrdI [Bacillus sp. APMAM]NEY97918.1 class Ib ribonucleoside-diphosphate reductase assembly flavoprotein NrdI [Heyndrickxia shackletonii]RTZ53875.1 class Ib ribonucleoside-diphosphate reductase assembly flavoprotein NrdI [Bacillus sp